MDGKELPEEESAKGSVGVELRNSQTATRHRGKKPAVETSGGLLSYADDITVVVKGTRAHAQEVREASRGFQEGQLKLTLNMEKTHITHVNDGFVFLGHRIIRKRGPRSRMRPVTTIPWTKYRGLSAHAPPSVTRLCCEG